MTGNHEPYPTGACGGCLNCAHLKSDWEDERSWMYCAKAEAADECNPPGFPFWDKPQPCYETGRNGCDAIQKHNEEEDYVEWMLEHLYGETTDTPF